MLQYSIADFFVKFLLLCCFVAYVKEDDGDIVVLCIQLGDGSTIENPFKKERLPERGENDSERAEIVLTPKGVVEFNWLEYPTRVDIDSVDNI